MIRYSNMLTVVSGIILPMILMLAANHVWFIWSKFISFKSNYQQCPSNHPDIPLLPTIIIIILPAWQIISPTNTIRCVWGAMSSGRSRADPPVAAPFDGGANQPVRVVSGGVVIGDSEVEVYTRGVLPHLQTINVVNNVVFIFIWLWPQWWLLKCERVCVDKNS